MWVWVTVGGDVGMVNGRGDVGVVNSKCMVIPFPSHMPVFLLVYLYRTAWVSSPFLPYLSAQCSDQAMLKGSMSVLSSDECTVSQRVLASRWKCLGSGLLCM